MELSAAETSLPIELKPGERIDDLLAGGLKIIQHEKEFCFSVDAVLLAHFATTRKNYRVLDLGTGTGVLPLLLSSKVAKLDAIELNHVTAEIAQRNVIFNKLEDKITIHHGDLCKIEEFVGHQSMDLVITNPPYRQLQHGRLNLLSGVARARHEVTAKLDDVVRAAAYALKYHGRIAMVHLPERLGEIILAFNKYNIEAKRLQFVQPKADISPNIVLIEGIKGGARGGLQVEPVLNIHEDNGDYTPTLLKWYYPDRVKES